MTFSTPITAGRAKAVTQPDCGSPIRGLRPRDGAELVAAHLGGTTGEAGRGCGSGRGCATGRLRSASAGGGGGSCSGSGGSEDLVRGLAGQQRLELLALDRLVLEQQLREPVEVVAAVAQDLAGGLVRLLDDPPDLVVDLARDLVRVVGRRR